MSKLNLRIMKIKNLHFISGVIIAIYVFFHLVNHLFGFAGVDRYMEVMESFRIVYRNPVVETLLLVAVAFQVVTGVTLFVRYIAGWIKGQRKITFFNQLQIWTGLYLSYFLVNHVWAVLAGRYIAQVDTGFYYGAAD